MSTAPIGSTTPESTPPRNALPFFSPSALSGMEIIAPSGKFCIAMPRDSASALAAVIWELSKRNPAYITPTAIPSGMLCSVTARTIIAVRLRLLLGPSACSLPICRCGIRWSSARRNSTPSQKPANAGRNESLPSAVDCSIAGISRLHIEAATITPAANPASERWTKSPSELFIKNTQAAPAAVPRKGNQYPEKNLHRFTVLYV